MNPAAEGYAAHISSTVHELRRAGHADMAQQRVRSWADRVTTPVDQAQLGIDMNFLGLFDDAAALLKSALAGGLVDYDAYLAKSELTIALYATGRYHEAHGLFRSLRDSGASALLLRQFYPSQVELATARLQSKFLGLSDSVAGKKVLVCMEGGVGDLVMYSRYFRSLMNDGAIAVHVQVPESAKGILHPEPWLKIADDFEAAVDECDQVTWLFNLFARYQTNPYFPQPDGSWIAAPDGRTLPSGARVLLDEGRDRIKVGLVWRSNSGVRHEPYRSIELQKLTPLMSNRACRFYSLQVGGVTEAEQAIFDEHGIADIGSQIATFAETATVLEELDLLISIDTGTAHLAGALGRPVYLLLSQACDSRWYDCQRFTPWYASARLYRQTTLGDWTTPLADLSADLAQACSSVRRGYHD
ncbi:glycosyltransferase family 9 protein [Paraburkholderia sp.]|uniref:glycosyltransferase family 9 protein n=1 Tax=Paraburkholderia sp. TaxID=1926495 RepID=UPI003D6E8AB3